MAKNKKKKAAKKQAVSKSKKSSKSKKVYYSKKAGPKKIKKSILQKKSSAKKVESKKSKSKKTSIRKDNMILPSEIDFSKEPIILKSTRKHFNKQIDQKVIIPSLIEIQLNSYDWFLSEGIRELLDEISPIQDF